ncbi:MAG: MopE-related protein, partial [Myxococcota bacterium]|nr:MopE-related protein [Myxococcota bacterium]
AVHLHNEVAWYFNRISSWGFAPAGANVNRQTCDTMAIAGEQRMCWETVEDRLSGGGRCGLRANNPAEYERIIFHRRGGPVTECSAVVGQPAGEEVCNDVDDDCDGHIDEGIPGVGDSCPLNTPTPCRRGVLRCQGDGQLTCQPVDVAPQVERCNGLDDDCDGQVDEHAVGSGEPCDLIGLGRCQIAQRQCIAPGELVCQAVADPAAQELCNGLDDDCDGRIDETFQQLGQGCFVGEGLCRREGRITCGGGRGELDLAFNGVRRDLTHEQAVEMGFTQCWSGHYGDQGPVNPILEACAENELMLACRRTGRPELSVAATGRRSIVLTDVRDERSPMNVHNGVNWFFSDSYSWGFVPEGALVVRRPCDIAQGEDAARLCWHTQNGTLREGYRCGQETGLNGDLWERVLYHRTAQPALRCDTEPGQPMEEQCNDADDDCDGLIDEAADCQ